MKRRGIMAGILALALAGSLAACGGGTAGSGGGAGTGGASGNANVSADGIAGDTGESEEELSGPQDGPTEENPATITLWTYPVGDWGNPGTVANLIAGFHKAHPEYQVSVECLSYDDADARIEEAIEAGELPDLVFEGPERLVANWGSRGLMVDLSDLWETETAGEIYDSVRNACRDSEGAFYEFPICMTAHCMVINRDMFEKAGALSYIDEENRTWTTDGFVKAVEAVKASGQEQVGVIYCGGQGGDQGTRGIVTNLYSGQFTSEDHSRYTVNSPENVKALELLKSLDGITFDPAIQGSDEIRMFGNGELAMAFCWNVSQEIAQTINHPDLDFDIFPMAFPTDNGEPTLQGGIWGFGIFDSGDETRIQGARTFIRYMAEEDSNYIRAVQTSTYWPVREIVGLYANDDLMNEYGIFTRYMGDYYQVAPNWADARTAWWQTLQKIGAGEDVAEALAAFDQTANGE